MATRIARGALIPIAIHQKTLMMYIFTERLPAYMVERAMGVRSHTNGAETRTNGAAKETSPIRTPTYPPVSHQMPEVLARVERDPDEHPPPRSPLVETARTSLRPSTFSDQATRFTGPVRVSVGAILAHSSPLPSAIRAYSSPSASPALDSMTNFTNSIDTAPSQQSSRLRGSSPFSFSNDSKPKG